MTGWCGASTWQKFCRSYSGERSRVVGRFGRSPHAGADRTYGTYRTDRTYGTYCGFPSQSSSTLTLMLLMNTLLLGSWAWMANVPLDSLRPPFTSAGSV